MGKPILCVDFDGVIHSYSSGWKGADVIPDPPVVGALQWLAKASEWWDVQIYSSRSSQPNGPEAMAAWLATWSNIEGVSLTVSFPEQKPPAFLTIDDRAVCFDGMWNNLDPQELLTFKPWNKREIGAAGTHSQGRLNDDDEGDLRMTVAFDPVDGVVRVEFGKPVAWLGLPPENAIAFAHAILKYAGRNP
jgi:hypothetical protein